MILIQEIQKAQNIILSTHKNSDGDGLGSEISMYLALKKLKKTVRFFHSDTIPARYHFLTAEIPEADFLNHLQLSTDSKPVDLVLIFDTHDPKLCSEVFDYSKLKNIPLFFIDHHVPTDYQTKKSHNFIDEAASCTGEIVYQLIKQLKVPVDTQMATSLYSSLIFDTQNFRFIRDFHKPFQMASELLSTGIDYEKIQQQLFAQWNVAKMNYLSFIISEAIYKKNDTVAIIKIYKKDLARFQVEVDQISDFVDLFMQINSLTVAVVIREESTTYHKISFRSRHGSAALHWARSFNGGGHATSSGAWVEKSMSEIEDQLDQLILN